VTDSHSATIVEVNLPYFSNVCKVVEPHSATVNKQIEPCSGTVTNLIEPHSATVSKVIEPLSNILCNEGLFFPLIIVIFFFAVPI